MTLNDRSAPRGDRIKAAKALAASTDPHAVDALLTEVTITDEGIAEAVRDSLRALKPTAMLEKRLEDSSATDWAKLSACQGLRVIKDPGSIPVLSRVFKDEKLNREVREAALHTLSAFAGTHADAEAAVIAALADNNPRIRSLAAMELGEIRSPAAKRAIEERLAVETDALALSSLEDVKRAFQRAPQ